MWEVGTIFHEKQDGRLCAQHCLNAALQGPYFSAVDLGELALRLDEDERLRMAENGIDSPEYKLFIQQPSGNMDDTGFFSVQVISRALLLWGLELIPLNSSDELAGHCRNDPTYAHTYIFNMESHWFCIRRFAEIWFNLNSLLNKPKFMSSLYLTEYLQQMQQEGYSIFIVSGNLPECPADTSPPTMKSITQRSYFPTIDLTESSEVISDNNLQKAIELSLSCVKDVEKNSDTVSELEAALQMSMECFESPAAPIVTPSVQDIRERRLAFFNKTE